MTDHPTPSVPETKEILPCPWCESPAHWVVSSGPYWTNRSVRCSADQGKCGVCGPGKRTKQEAIAAWNSVAALRARVLTLEAELKKAANMLGAVAGDIEDGYSLDSLRGKYLVAVVNARDAARAALSPKP